MSIDLEKIESSKYNDIRARKYFCLKLKKEVWFMLAAVKGYYDGTQIVVDENDKNTLNIGDEVIITILDRLNVTGKESRTEKRRRVVDQGKYVMPGGRSEEEIDAYIRELRNHDRF